MIAFGPTGNLYIADAQNFRIRRVDASSGVITTIAGTGAQGFGGDGGAATSATFGDVGGMAADAAGNVYVSDTNNNRIRKISAATGVVTTVAGNGTDGFSADGTTAIAAMISRPTGVAVNASGAVYFTDANRIRRVNQATGRLETVAGNGNYGFDGNGGSALNASLGYPGSIAIDPSGNLFIGESNGLRVRKVDVGTGVISTVLGDAPSGDGSAATDVVLVEPSHTAVDSRGNVYVNELYGHRVRKISASTGAVTSVAGTGQANYGGDDGPAASAWLSYPSGVAVDSADNLLIADGSDRIRRVSVCHGCHHDDRRGRIWFRRSNGPATSAKNSGITLALRSMGRTDIFVADRTMATWHDASTR